MGYFWKIQGGKVYSTDDMDFVTPEEGMDIVLLYMDTSDAKNLVLADITFLRETLRLYELPLGEVLKTRLDRIEDIQAAYAPQLADLQSSKAGADMRGDDEDVEEIKAEYVALLREMQQKIQAVPND